MNTSPNACLLLKGILTSFPSRPLLHLWKKRCCAPPSSVSSGSLLVVPQLETHCNQVLLSGEVCFALQMLSFSSEEEHSYSKLGPSSPGGHLTNSTKEETGNFLLGKYILLSE